MAMNAATKAFRKAERDRKKYMASLESIADQVKFVEVVFENEQKDVFGKMMDVPVRKEIVEVELFGAVVKGEVSAVNKVLEKAGYRPVRVTSNMLNPESKTWCVDIDTPAYLDPGCESYHTM